MNFKLVNTISGWVVFLMATFVYAISAEPTVSLWDCGEFISGCYKMQVMHPPGAPLFLMIGRLFSLFASDPSKVAYMINFMSGVCTAFGVLFVFWSITFFSRKLLNKTFDDITLGESIAVLLAGFVGAMACTFATSVWFSAVEGEVYAMSFAFTGLAFWSILKWWDDETEHADRWLLFIAYTIGLSIGVHLLSLLTIPAIVLVYYLKKYKYTSQGFVLALLSGAALLGFVQMFMIPKIPQFAALFDRIFVNSIGLPFGSGVAFFMLLLLTFVVLGLRYANRNNKPLVERVVLSCFLILLGFSTYLMVVIRANAGVSINMNRPIDAYSLLSYLNREQYGDRPLVYGEWWGAEPTEQVNGKKLWRKGKEKYDENGYKQELVYSSADKMLFPRIGSHDPGLQHDKLYQNFLGLSKEDKPTMADNLKFFFGYQFNHMYWRYFMWNFAGRQNDKQGIGGRDVTSGNWISGISAYDSARLYDWSKAPDWIKNNPAENKYYLIPLLLGFVGMLFQFKRNAKHGWVVFLLWFFTGIAIMIFLNNPPVEPRERDYGFAGSVMAYCIWIGLGVLAIFDFLKDKIPAIPSALVAGVAGVLAPAIMLQQNWDDHNRSNRYAAHDFGANFLNSVEKNAIIFTIGDNDTYPLWYCQEVEGIRRDVRIVNLSLLAVDWYIDQLFRKVNDSAPLNFSFTKDKIEGSNRDYTPVLEVDNAKNAYVPLKDIMNYVFSDNPDAKRQLTNGMYVNIFPARNFTIPVDTNKVRAMGMVDPKNKTLTSEMRFSIGGNGIMKNDLMILDIINSNLMSRPIYFATTVPTENFNGLNKYLQLEGLAMRVVPAEGDFKNNSTRAATVYADKVMENVNNRFKWGNVDKERVYLDPPYMPSLSNLTNMFIETAKTYAMRGDSANALKTLDKYLASFTQENKPLDYFSLDIIQLYYIAGNKNKASELGATLADRSNKELTYYYSLPEDAMDGNMMEIQMALQCLQSITQFAKQFNDTALFDKVKPNFEKAVAIYRNKGLGN